MEKSAALDFFVGAKNSAAFMKKGGMTDAIFSTSFCITDSVGGITIPAGETERRAQEEQTEMTHFKMGADGNICSYFFHHAVDRFSDYIFIRRFFKMAYFVWGLTVLAIILGFLLGLVLGRNHHYQKEAVGTLLVGYTGEEDDAAHLFLNMDCPVEDIEVCEYAVLRVKKVKARK